MAYMNLPGKSRGLENTPEKTAADAGIREIIAKAPEFHFHKDDPERVTLTVDLKALGLDGGKTPVAEELIGKVPVLHRRLS